MTTKPVTTKPDPARPYTPHPLRAAVLGEIHARPFQTLSPPARFAHFGFMTDAAQAVADRAALNEFCTARGAPPPAPQAKHHRARFGAVELRWEQHSEFTTYTWQTGAGGARPFAPAEPEHAAMMRELPQPGPLLVRADLHFIPAGPEPALEELFDPSSLAACAAGGGAAVVATDFMPGHGGAVRILIADRGLSAPRAGVLAQRMLEIETYRILALLGLPEAQRLAPRIKYAEDALASITAAMGRSDGLSGDHELLGRLTDIAAGLEADAAAANYRFGASRAYDHIVSQRLEAINEGPHAGFSSLTSFLSRRMSPAMRTCRMLEERQENLANKLMRTANLLRTRVDVEIERQNRDLLHSMNERTRLQLRLQQTVEGLSVAAISYYIVGLAAYLLKGLKDAGYGPDPAISTAAAVPVAVLAVAYVVRRIRRTHKGEDKPA